LTKVGIGVSSGMMIDEALKTKKVRFSALIISAALGSGDKLFFFSGDIVK
jgi:hypothetical protein